MLPDGVYHFSFVNRSTFILTTTRHSGYIHLVTISDSEELHARTIIEFGLPKIEDNVQVEAVITHSGAITASPTDDERFIATPERRIHTFTVMYEFVDSDPILEAETYTLFVPNDTLLRYISEHKDKPKNLIVWDDWGPKFTRMLKNQGPPDRMRWVTRIIPTFFDG